MTDTKKDKWVLVKVKDLNDQQLDTAIDKALDALFGKHEEETAAPARRAVPAGKKPFEVVTFWLLESG